MKVYAYLRVSTDQQVESGAGLAAQEDACNRWAQDQKKEISEIFTEKGVSGSTALDKRPALLQAIDALKKGDILLVAKRDRLGRDPIAVAMIEAGVARKGASILSTAGEGTGSEDPTSVLMRRLVDAFAEFERNMIRGRTKAAMQAKKARGERVGHIQFGYRLAEDGVHIEPDDYEQGVLKQIAELKKAKYSTRKIAYELNQKEQYNRKGSRWNHNSIHLAMKKVA